jgi:hypothetical protein
MQNEKPPPTDDLVAMIRSDCRAQAKQIETKFAEVIQCLEDENHLGALKSSSSPPKAPHSEPHRGRCVLNQKGALSSVRVVPLRHRTALSTK